jgi:Leucine-rich repeat (LRR) protein
VPQCNTGINATIGCVFGSTMALGDSVTIATTSDAFAEIQAVGCVNKTTTELLETVFYPISATDAGVVTFNPVPSAGNRKLHDSVAMSSANAVYLCVTHDNTDPTCSATEVGHTCGNGVTHLGNTVHLNITNNQKIFKGIGCMDEVTAASAVGHAEYTMGPIASSPTFGIVGDYYNPDNTVLSSTSTNPTIVRKGANVHATSTHSVIVCMKSWALDTLNGVEPLPPTCNDLNGTVCGTGSSPNDIVIADATSTTLVSAIGCTLKADAGTHSVVSKSWYTVGKIVKQTTVLPASQGKVQENTNIRLASSNADMICFSTSSGSPTSSMCLTNGTGCVNKLNEYSSTNGISVTSNNVPLTINVEGCTSMVTMGINYVGTIGPFEIGPSAELPRLTTTGEEEAAEEAAIAAMVATDGSTATVVDADPPSVDAPVATIKAGNIVNIISKNSLSICLVSSVVDVFVEDNEAAQTSIIALVPEPVCDSTGMSCTTGESSDRTLPELTTDYTSTKTLIIKAIGCQDVTLGTGGGKHSNVLTKTYTIVPQLEAPVLDPRTYTLFKNSQGQIAIAGEQATGGACYVSTNKIEQVATTTCPLQPPECRDDPGSNVDKCIIGTHVDTNAGTTIPVAEDLIICVQSCSHSTQTGLHSTITVGQYTVLKGSTKQLNVLASMHTNMNGDDWLYPWDLDSYYCDLNGIECDVCQTSEAAANDAAAAAAAASCPNRNNIIKLNLGYVGLSGDSNLVDVSGLEYLNELALPGNQLTGPLPDVSGLTALTSLTLFYNQLTGGLPDQDGDLPLSLVELDLDHNRLSGSIPESISTLVNLKSLDLSNNQFTGSIPPGIGELIQLTKLDLSNNQFSGEVPPSFSNLVNLKKLNLDSNTDLDITLSDEVCDRTKQCMPPLDESGGSVHGGKSLLASIGLYAVVHFMHVLCMHW